MRYKANPTPPWNPPTSIGHMPGLWGGKVGCLIGRHYPDQAPDPPTSIGHMSGLWGGKNGLPGKVSRAPGEK